MRYPSGVLPGELRAHVEESVLLSTPQGLKAHPLFPDVRVVRYAPKRPAAASVERSVALADPLVIDAEPETVTETFIEIIDRESGNVVVTVIEFLSPANKSPGPNQEQYLRKQREICASTANLVEIDLNRFGSHTLAFAMEQIEPQAMTPYMACVRRATCRHKAEVYPMPLWQRLPAIRIPLRPKDKDVPLDLQALVEQCYRNGAYEGTLDYSVDPDPPLLGVEKDWAEKHMAKVGLRGKKRPRRNGKGKSK